MGKHTGDLTGMRFGRLVALARVDDKVNQYNEPIYLWRCQCDCGKVTEARRGNLLGGSTRSCGCLRRESARLAALAARHNVQDLL